MVGSLLYYARAVDNTLLPALNAIAQQQAHPTEESMRKCKRLLDYVATFPNVFIRFYKSDMILTIDSDAAYLVLPGARSRIAGFFQMNSLDKTTPFRNGALLVECKSLRHVVASSAEAEVAGIFHNAQTAIPIRYMLAQLGHPQPATPLKTDNATALNFVKNNITQKRSKSWDMRFYWLRDKKQQKMFDIFWDKSEANIADYHTKHHPIAHHRLVRHMYVKDRPGISDKSNPQGCAGVGARASPRPRGSVNQIRHTSPGVNWDDGQIHQQMSDLMSETFRISA